MPAHKYGVRVSLLDSARPITSMIMDETMDNGAEMETPVEAPATTEEAPMADEAAA